MKKILLVFLAIWISISVIRTGYNLSKIFTEEKDWLLLSETQKKEKIFGDLDPFFRFVEKNTSPKDSILFLSPGGKTYYLGRYYLYPRRLIYLKNPNEVNSVMKNCSYNYLLIYQTSDSNLDEFNSNSWKISLKNPMATYYSSTSLGSKGMLYKL